MSVREVSGFSNGTVILSVIEKKSLTAYVTDVLLVPPDTQSFCLWKEDYEGVPIEVISSINQKIPSGELITLTVTFTPENLLPNHEYRVVLRSQRGGYFSPIFTVLD